MTLSCQSSEIQKNNRNKSIISNAKIFKFDTTRDTTKVPKYSIMQKKRYDKFVSTKHYDDLEAFINNTEKELQEMNEAREILRNELKKAVRSGDENQQKELRDHISTLTGAMRILRKNLKILNRVKLRAEDVVAKMDSINEHSKTYERYAYDSIRTNTNKTHQRKIER